MVGIEEISAYRDLGIGAISLIIIYSFARWTGDRAFIQVEDANKRSAAVQQQLISFIENAYKDNTKVMSELVNSFKEHTRSKDNALEMLKEQQQLLKDQLHIIEKLHDIET